MSAAAGPAQVEYLGEPAVMLRAADGSEAMVLPGTGANCVTFRAPLAEKGMVSLIAGPDSAAPLRAAPNSAGIPLLWPHPGQHRLPLVWEGKEHAPVSADGVARNGRLTGHGFVSAARWEVVETSDDAVTCRLDTRRLPGGDGWWPWPAVLTVTHKIGPGELSVELEVKNVAPGHAPLMAGLHPYFPLRFIGDDVGARETCAVWVDADQQWDLVGGLATGRVWRLDNRSGGEGGEQVSDRGAMDVRWPRTVAELEAHATARGGRLGLQLYGRRDPSEAEGGVTSGVWDRTAGIGLTLETGRGFGTVGVYCPADRPVVSLEPRSAVHDALSLAATHPTLDTGLRALAPGDRWRCWARFRLTQETRERS